MEEYVKAKDTYANFTYSDINAVEIASYALCAIIITNEAKKDTWEKDMDSLKTMFDDCMEILTT